jgi:hypothetical protein
MAHREVKITVALDTYNAGVFTSLRGAARAYRILRPTFQHRASGVGPHATAYAAQMRFSPD